MVISKWLLVIGSETPAVICLLSSVFGPLHLSRALYKSALFMQNKANFRKAKMKLNFYLTKDYDNERLHRRGKNKANQTQSPRQIREIHPS